MKNKVEEENIAQMYAGEKIGIYNEKASKGNDYNNYLGPTRPEKQKKAKEIVGQIERRRQS